MSSYCSATIRFRRRFSSSSCFIPPPRQENRLQSVATIPDGYAVVVGGLEVESQMEAESRVPIVGSIPLVGNGDEIAVLRVPAVHGATKQPIRGSEVSRR